MGNRHQLWSILLSCFSIWYSKKSGSSVEMWWKLGHKGVNKGESKGRATRAWNEVPAIKGKTLAQNKEHPTVLLFSALYFPFFPGKWPISRVLTSWTVQFYPKRKRQWCVTAQVAVEEISVFEVGWANTTTYIRGRGSFTMIFFTGSDQNLLILRDS